MNGAGAEIMDDSFVDVSILSFVYDAERGSPEARRVDSRQNHSGAERIRSSMYFRFLT